MDSSELTIPVSTIFARSLRDRPIEDWEPLSHLTAVGNRAGEFAEAFGWKVIPQRARVAAEAYGTLGRMLAFAGHHSGLADFSDLERRLNL